MKLALLSAILGSAAAFAPAPTGRVSTSVSETKADLEVLAKKLNPIVGFYGKLQLYMYISSCIYILYSILMNTAANLIY